MSDGPRKPEPDSESFLDSQSPLAELPLSAPRPVFSTQNPSSERGAALLPRPGGSSPAPGNSELSVPDPLIREASEADATAPDPTATYDATEEPRPTEAPVPFQAAYNVKPEHDDTAPPSSGPRATPRPMSMRERIVSASIPPPPMSQRPSVAPRLPGVAVGATEAQKGSVDIVAHTARAIRRIEPVEFFRQMNAIGLQSLGFICLVLGFVGAILVYQAGLQALRIVPDTSNVGSSYLELLVRDLAASITGLMLATRVGAGIAAEVGSMKVTDQLDAMRLCQTDPVDYLIAPRVVASALTTPILTIFGGAVAVLTGAATGYIAFGINPTVFLDGRYIDIGDLLTGGLKSVAFGISIPLIAAHAGLYTSGGSEGVGNATTRAVVGASLAVIILGFIIGALGQVIFE